MSSFKFKCIAMVLLFCLTLPIFAEDVYSFKAANSYAFVFEGNSETSKEGTEINTSLFSVSSNSSKGFFGTNLDNKPTRMLTEAAEAEKPAAKSNNTVWWIIGGALVIGMVLGTVYALSDHEQW